MKTLEITLIASLIGTAVGLGSWMLGLGRIMWPAHPQMACFLLTLATTIVIQVAWPRLTETNSQWIIPPIEETNGLACLFDPSTLTWTTTGSMSTSRFGESMTVLPNGQVLVAGGDTFDKQTKHLFQTTSAELYTR
jgi:hypothetical protein